MKFSIEDILAFVLEKTGLDLHAETRPFKTHLRLDYNSYYENITIRVEGRDRDLFEAEWEEFEEWLNKQENKDETL